MLMWYKKLNYELDGFTILKLRGVWSFCVFSGSQSQVVSKGTEDISPATILGLIPRES